MTGAVVGGGGAAGAGLTWKEISKRPELWPPVTTTTRPVNIEGGVTLPEGQRLLVVHVHPSEVEVLVPGGQMARLQPDECDLLESARALHRAAEGR